MNIFKSSSKRQAEALLDVMAQGASMVLHEEARFARLVGRAYRNGFYSLPDGDQGYLIRWYGWDWEDYEAVTGKSRWKHLDK